MSKATAASYSRYSRDALALLGALIRAARKQRAISVVELAERVGISRGLIQRIEKGDLRCQIGAVFEVAAVVGVRLFDLEGNDLSARLRDAERTLALLPRSVRQKSKVAFDDF